MEIGTIHPRKIIVILGPTGVGKSAHAVSLAKKYSGEIISADSMQVYRHFDIGTDKLTPDKMDGIAHHGIDIYEPYEQSTAHRFLENTWHWCQEIVGKGHLPIICGGTSLYLRVLQQGIFSEEGQKDDTRTKLNEELSREGLSALWSKLKCIDPEYAEKIGKNDERRILRGLEISSNTGVPPSQAFLMNQTPFSDYHFIRIGLNLDRPVLYERIEKRVDLMISKGLIDETRCLRAVYPSICPPFQGVGYKEICTFLDGFCSLETAVELIKQHSRNYAKRQLSWWRQEKDIIWFEPEQYDDIEALIKRELCQ